VLFRSGGDGGETPAALAHKAPDPGPDAGWFIKWVVNLYNDNMILYSIVALVIMTLMGCILGFATDRFLELLGFETKKLEHHE
jgi:hypothetical protein